MNTDIQIFNNPMFGEIRTMTGADGEPWFVGKDVAEALGYKNPSNALTVHVEKEDKTSYLIQVSGSSYKTNTCFINESGLYSLILQSKLPQAKEFKRWVTAVVLPQIRRTGGYIPITVEDDEKTILAKAIQISQRTIEEKDRLIEVMKPMAQLGEAVSSTDDSILIRDLAKILTQNGIPIGQTRLFRWLRENNFLFQRETRPIQRWVEEGIFDTNVTVIESHHGSKERITTKVTGKGQAFFINGFLSGRFVAI